MPIHPRSLRTVGAHTSIRSGVLRCNSKAINIIRGCRYGWRSVRRGEEKRRLRRWRRRRPQPATKPITINRSATAHSAKSTRFERAATLDYIPRTSVPHRGTHVFQTANTILNGKSCLSLRPFILRRSSIKHFGVIACWFCDISLRKYIFSPSMQGYSAYPWSAR